MRAPATRSIAALVTGAVLMAGLTGCQALLDAVETEQAREVAEVYYAFEAAQHAYLNAAPDDRDAAARAWRETMTENMLVFAAGVMRSGADFDGRVSGRTTLTNPLVAEQRTEGGVTYLTVVFCFDGSTVRVVADGEKHPGSSRGGTTIALTAAADRLHDMFRVDDPQYARCG